MSFLGQVLAPRFLLFEAVPGLGFFLSCCFTCLSCCPCCPCGPDWWLSHVPSIQWGGGGGKHGEIEHLTSHIPVAWTSWHGQTWLQQRWRDVLFILGAHMSGKIKTLIKEGTMNIGGKLVISAIASSQLSLLVSKLTIGSKCVHESSFWHVLDVL